MAEYQIGAKREEFVEVGHDNAIRFLGPEGPRVLSTPQMILFMERTCRNLILSMVDPGHDTVGTHVNVSHMAAAPMGSKVTFFGGTGCRDRIDARSSEWRPGSARGSLVKEHTKERLLKSPGLPRR